MPTQEAELARLNAELDSLRRQFDRYIEQTDKQIEDLAEKLEVVKEVQRSLINRGLGAVMIVASIGALVGWFSSIWDKLSNHLK